MTLRLSPPRRQHLLIFAVIKAACPAATTAHLASGCRHGAAQKVASQMLGDGASCGRQALATALLRIINATSARLPPGGDITSAER